MSKSNNLITIKVGTHVITGNDSLPDKKIIRSISNQISDLKQKGFGVILISSGAVAAGRSIYQSKQIQDAIERRQVLSSLGQVELITLYKNAFNKTGMHCSQVLVTKEDFKSRSHYLNMKNCVTALLKNDIVPIINENDVVSVTELMFTDNDELAGLVSAMINTDLLIMLTSVDGIFDGDPDDPGSNIIEVYDSSKIDEKQISAGKQSEFGRGGILTKCRTADKIAGMGIPVHIANGKKEKIILNIVDEVDGTGTLFPPRKSASNIKKYIAHAYDAKGKVTINEGAREALTSDTARSLLPVGITDISGEFRKGDVIRIEDENGEEIGLGLSRFDAEKVEQLKGRNNEKPLIHYDHLYLY